jgi:predicted DNA-binding ribbon-helix-helix protein
MVKLSLCATPKRNAAISILMARLRGRNLTFSVTRRSTKRSITIAGHKTSIRLEDEFWDSLREISVKRGMSPAELVVAIDGDRQHANLPSAIRLFVLNFYRDQCH